MDALGLERRQDPAFNRGVDRGDGRADVEGMLARPLARALLLGFVEDQIDQGPPGLGVRPREDLGGDLDEVRAQVPVVPLLEDLAQFLGVQPQAARQQIVRLGDELHVAVFDAVVHHLHVVPGAARAHVVHARLPIVRLRRDGAEDGRQRLPGFPLAARHDGGAPQRALLAAGDAGADVVEAAGSEFLAPALGVEEPGVAAVNQDVAGLQMRLQVGDRAVHGGAGRHHHQDPARPLQHRHQRVGRRRKINVTPRGRAGDERLALGSLEIVARDAEPVALHVEGQVGPHHPQADDADVTLHETLLWQRGPGGTTSPRRGARR